MMTTFPYWNIYKKYGEDYGLSYTDILKAVDLYKQGIVPVYIPPGSPLEYVMLYVMTQFANMRLGIQDWYKGFSLPWEAS